MKHTWIMTLVLLAVVGCVERRNGPEMTEIGEVYDTCFVPAGHSSGIKVTYDMDLNPHMTPYYNSIPARYSIVFKCEHGKFVIGDDRGKRLYNKLSKGDVVVIRYCQELEIDNKQGFTNAVDLHFIDADIAK